MKIVHIMPGSLYQGGVGTLTRFLCESLVMHRHEVTVYYLSKELDHRDIKETEKGVIVKRFNPIIGDPFYMPPHSLTEDLSKENANIIHVHNVNTLLPAYIATLGSQFSRAIILQPHYHRHGQNAVRNLFFSIYKKIFKTVAFQYYDVIIANSQYERITLQKDFPNISSKIALVPEEYSITVPPHVRWKPSVQIKKVLSVGALTKYKNVDSLIRAFKVLTLRRQDLELVIVGDGPERERLMTLAHKLEVYDRIKLKKRLLYNELLHEYANANVVVLLSSLESFSRVAHEAIAIGAPLIVYDYGALSELVKEGLAKGVNTLDPKVIAYAINEAINNNRMATRPTRTLNGGAYTDLIIMIYENLMRQVS
jgi:glycosyltransferase involved in cell wall biosynthesis